MSCGLVNSRKLRRKVVIKFGSSVLTGISGYRQAAAEMAGEVERGRAVIAVVSAAAGRTDALAGAARQVNPAPSARWYSELLATAEEASVRVLTLAAEAQGMNVLALSAAELGISTRGTTLDSEPDAVDVARLKKLLGRHDALVVPGFVGVGENGETTLLGRGGSDLTALFLASRLRTEECRLVKDVDGLYRRDPNRSGDPGPRLLRATWSDVLQFGGALVQEKAVKFAESVGQGFSICGAQAGDGTRVGCG